jgi:hypothetical protein
MAHKTNKTTETEVTAVSVAPQIRQDTMLAILIVSLTVNLFVLVGWVTLQVTSAYDAQVAAFLFVR